jgi:hypothetical protein
LFGWLETKSVQNHPEIRDTLFGDLPFSRWATVVPTETPVDPWSSFARAKKFLDSGDKQSAKEGLLSILEMSELESRHYLQAWHFLRDLGVNPPSEKEKDLRGVVVEVDFGKGLDVVAAYSDHHARYYNYSGAGVVWERPNNSLDSAIDDLMRVGAATMQAIGPWKGNRPSAPPVGHARINLLSPVGLNFEQGPLDALTKGPLGGPVITAPFRLMQELIKLTRK